MLKIIDAYAKSFSTTSASDAERIFRMMESDYGRGNKEARPNIRSFNTVINAWAKSDEPGSALRAEEILERMLNLFYEEVTPSGFYLGVQILVSGIRKIPNFNKNCFLSS